MKGYNDDKKFDDPNYYGYSQLLYEKKNEEILDKIIKRLKLHDKKSREQSNSPVIDEIRNYA